MAGICKATQEEFNKSMSSVAQCSEERTQEKAKDRATPLKEVVKSDFTAKITSMFEFWGRRPEFGSGDHNRTTASDAIRPNDGNWHQLNID